MNVKRGLIVLLACLATQIALGEPAFAEKNAAEKAAIEKEWESWNAPFQTWRIESDAEKAHARPALHLWS